MPSRPAQWLPRPGGAVQGDQRSLRVLKDPQKRAAYDRFGKAAFQNGGGGTTRSRKAGFNGFSDIFSTIFGEFMDPRARGRTQRVAPTSATISS